MEFAFAHPRESLPYVRAHAQEMDEAVMQYLKRKYNLLVGERTAEQIKMEIGSAYPLEKPLTMEVKGRNLIEGVPRTVTIDDSEIRDALSECVAPLLRLGARMPSFSTTSLSSIHNPIPPQPSVEPTW